MVIAIGDIHGDFKFLREFILSIDSREVDFIQVGDFGAGFGSRTSLWHKMSKINSILSEKDSHLHIIRGNHDDPVFWNTDLSEKKFKFSNLHFVRDWSVKRIKDRTFLFAGGAVSIDREFREWGKTYWPGENMTPVNLSAANGEPIDVIVTHDILLSISNPNLRLGHISVSESIQHDIYYTQKVLMDLYNGVEMLNKGKPLVWVHGHEHKSYVYKKDNTTIIGLGINEVKEL